MIWQRKSLTILHTFLSLLQVFIIDLIGNAVFSYQLEIQFPFQAQFLLAPSNKKEIEYGDSNIISFYFIYIYIYIYILLR